MESFAPYDLAHARRLDATDALPARRDDFHVPQHDGADVVYFTGTSGASAKAAEDALRAELNDWAEHGVEGHFRPDIPGSVTTSDLLTASPNSWVPNRMKWSHERADGESAPAFGEFLSTRREAHENRL